MKKKKHVHLLSVETHGLIFEEIHTSLLLTKLYHMSRHYQILKTSSLVNCLLFIVESYVHALYETKAAIVETPVGIFLPAKISLKIVKYIFI